MKSPVKIPIVKINEAAWLIKILVVPPIILPGNCVQKINSAFTMRVQRHYKFHMF